ncbi:MAG: SAM-dependent methyltransferase, partial [Gammaproteobacteria bacterium]
MNEIVNTDNFDSAGFGSFDRFLRQRLLAQLKLIRHGSLMFEDTCGRFEFGEPEDAVDLHVHLQVLDPGFYRALARNGSVGAGEAYMDGLWRCNDLVGLVQLLVRNRDLLDGMETGLA